MIKHIDIGGKPVGMIKQLCVALLALVCVVVPAQSGDTGIRANKELFDEACRAAMLELGTSGGLTASSSVVVKLIGGERTEFFRPIFIDALTTRCRAVYVSGSASDTVVTIALSKVGVGYGPAFREGWFRERKTERTVSVAVRMEMVSTSSGKILSTGLVEKTLRDTIAVDDIADAGASTRQIAIGEPPGPTLWERILEPAILTVSSGIAVYLFFTVRS